MIIAKIINKTLAILVLTVYNAYYSKERNRTMTIHVKESPNLKLATDDQLKAELHHRGFLVKTNTKRCTQGYAHKESIVWDVTMGRYYCTECDGWQFNV